jgi:soluble lytic murein transglycosylase-like protein
MKSINTKGGAYYGKDNATIGAAIAQHNAAWASLYREASQALPPQMNPFGTNPQEHAMRTRVAWDNGKAVPIAEALANHGGNPKDPKLYGSIPEDIMSLPSGAPTTGTAVSSKPWMPGGPTPAQQSTPGQQSARPDKPDTNSVKNLIIDKANEAGVPPALALAVAQHESSFDPHAFNPRGEGNGAGLFGFASGTGKGRGMWDQRYDAATSATHGTQYLAELYKKTGDWGKALRLYGGADSGAPGVDTQYDTHVLRKMMQNLDYVAQRGKEQSSKRGKE